MGETTITGFIGEIPKEFEIAYTVCIRAEREAQE